MNALEWLVDALTSAAGDNLVSLTHTSSAKSAEASAKRLSTLTIVLKDTEAAALAVIREPLREGARRTRVTPYVLNAAELPNMLDTLPLRALMTRAHGISLVGDNPFAGLTIEPEHIRLRLEQEVRNLLVRLRHDLVLAPPQSHLLLSGMWRTVRGVERVLEGLAFLKHGEDDLPSDLWASGVQDWDLPSETLSLLGGFGDAPPTESLHEIAAKVLPLLQALVVRVDRLEA